MTRSRDGAGSTALLVRSGMRLAALPLSVVEETMRPLPVEVLSGLPSFVVGVSVVRGEPAPVVALGVVLGEESDVSIGRFVAVKATHSQRYVLAVTEVVGIRSFDSASLSDLPRILGANASEVAAALATHDERLVLVLQAARLVPPEVWAQMKAGSGH